jgi:cysteine sulfinate desulfinase/cysteine desulfurase-like protein
VRISAGTACTSLARTPPEALLAAGHARDVASRAVRFSCAWSSGADDVDRALAALDRVLPRVRAAWSA